jgi:hypothetical protein
MMEDDTIYILSHNQHHFDPARLDELMVPFVQLLFHFELICQCLGLWRAVICCKNASSLLWYCFRRRSASAYLCQILLSVKVIGDPTWLNLQHPSDIFNDVTHRELVIAIFRFSWCIILHLSTSNSDFTMCTCTFSMVVIVHIDYPMWCTDPEMLSSIMP